jgi:hypothetical protein
VIGPPDKAAEPVAESALILRTAASITDPYRRADRIWDAVTRLRQSLAHRATRAGEDLAFALEQSCDGSEPPPESEGLLPHARALEDYARTLRGLEKGDSGQAVVPCNEMVAR